MLSGMLSLKKLSKEDNVLVDGRYEQSWNPIISSADFALEGLDSERVNKNLSLTGGLGKVLNLGPPIEMLKT